MRKTSRALVALAVGATLVTTVTADADASARRSMSRSITTGGTVALSGWGAITFLDTNDVNNADITVTDHKCDGRGGSTAVEYRIREYGGYVQWASGMRVSSTGCGTTNGRYDKIFPGIPVSQIYRARLKVCFDDAGCFYSSEVDNPYNDDPERSNG